MAETLPTIQTTLAYKTILLTGATGFVGKAIIEKLLRTVPSIQHIYAVIRPREACTAAERLEQDIFKSPLFDRLRHEKPDFDAFVAAKVTAVAGDVTLPMLGLSATDLARVQTTVQVAIHSAASVRFNEPLDIAVQANCIGTLHTLELVNSCSSLECHVHVSSAYANANQRNGDSTIVEEELYPLDFDVEEAVAAVTSCSSPDEVQTLHAKLMGSFPNTYTLTKAMTEHLVAQRMRPTVPLVILRPSIVGATWQDPMPGFIDQVGGAPTIYLAIGMGVVSLMALDETKVVDLVPLDFVVHTALASIAYALVVKPTTPFIVHAGTSDPRAKPTDYAQPTRAAVEYFQQHPPKRGIFKPSYQAIASPTLFRMAWGFSYELPLRVLSTVAALSRIPWLQKQAAKLQKLTDRAQKIIDTFRPVTNHEWIFHGDNAVLLREQFRSEHEDWWLDVRDLDWERWMRQQCMGLKKYILKEGDIEIETIAPAA